jgi:hypothetical protein
MAEKSLIMGITLEEALLANALLWEALHRLPSLHLPDWYLGAGCVAQTIWNLAHGKPAGEDILDYDLVYFDSDVSEEAEEGARRRACELLSDLGLVLDMKNQARVHVWYRQRFGYDIGAYVSAADAIATWPTTATAVGVRADGDELSVCAPFGLGDLFGLVIRANRVQVTREIYQAKVGRWLQRWPSLTVLPWDEGVGIEGCRRAEWSTP